MWWDDLFLLLMIEIQAISVFFSHSAQIKAHTKDIMQN